jgi:hypothetical protein
MPGMTKQPRCKIDRQHRALVGREGDMTMTHDIPRPGVPCLRCGIKFNNSTAYLPCLEPGDTLATWVARHANTLLAAGGSVPSLLREMATRQLIDRFEQSLRAKRDPAHPHLIDGEFQSDKYPSCPRGKVPLSTKDPTAQDLLWEYAQRRRAVDAQFADDLELALRAHGYAPTGEKESP